MKVVGHDTVRMILILLSVISASLPLRAQESLPKAQTTPEVIASGGKLIAGDTIRQMLVGNTVYVTWLATSEGLPRGSTNFIFHPDERRRIVPFGRGKNRVERLWWIEGNAYCAEAFDQKSHYCNLLYDANGTIYRCHRDTHHCNHIMRVAAGNVERL